MALHYALRTLLLGPVIVPEGLWLRWHTPHLLTPPGDTAGHSGEGPPLSLLLAGDSAIAGVGADTWQQTLIGQLLPLLVATRRVDWRVVATSGHRSADMLLALEALPPLAVDVAVLSVGANDIIGQTPRRRWEKVRPALIQTLKTRCGARRIVVCGLPPIHRCLTLPQPLRRHLGQRALELTRELEQTAAADPALAYFDLEWAGDSQLLARDGIHPGPPAYAEWARRLLPLVAPPEALPDQSRFCNSNE